MKLLKTTQTYQSRPLNNVIYPTPFTSTKTPVQRLTRTQAQPDDKPDLIESLVGKLFGQKALEDTSPFGMKRLTVDDTPELWPAVTDEFAEPLPGDDPEVALIRPLLAKTQMEKVPLRKAYDTDIHGWSCETFHQCVDAFGATLIVATTQGGSVIGGYNPRGFLGLGEDRDSIAAFLFTYLNGDMTQRPIKVQKVGGASLACIDNPSVGVKFGPDNLVLLAPGNEKVAKCRLGTYYDKLPNGSRSLFGEKDDPKKTELVNLRAFVMEGKGEEWNLDGIVWKTEMKN